MKIKGSSEKANIASLSFVFPVLTVVSVVLRALQIFRSIDTSTGFYTETGILTVLFYVIIFGSCLAFCVVSFFSKDGNAVSLNGAKDKGLFVVTLLFAFVLLYDGIKVFLDSFGVFLGGFEESYIEVSPAKQLMSSGVVFDVLESIFAFLSAVYFFVLASSFKTGKDKTSSCKILALSPVCWTAFRMLGLFVTKISFLRVSDLFLELAQLAFMVLFFMAFAQVMSGVYSEGNRWRIAAFGLSSALISGCISIPRLIFTLINSEKYINSAHPFLLIDLMFCIFASVIIFTSVKKTFNTENSEEPAEALPKEESQGEEID